MMEGTPAAAAEHALSILPPDLRLFSLVSWGCAGTAWLARALNSHPYILCAHHLRFGLDRVGGASLSAPAYLAMLAAGEEGYKAIGDVHGVYLHEIAQLRAMLGDRFGWAVLVREPLARLRSLLALFRKGGYDAGWGDLGHVDAVAESVGVDPAALDVERRFALHGINVLNTIIAEHAAGARVFRLEDVTREPQAFTELAQVLIGDAIRCEPAWVSSMLAMPHSNRHASPAPAELDAWTLDMVRRIVRPEAWEIYRALGYATPAAG